MDDGRELRVQQGEDTVQLIESIGAGAGTEAGGPDHQDPNSQPSRLGRAERGRDSYLVELRFDFENNPILMLFAVID